EVVVERIEWRPDLAPPGDVAVVAFGGEEAQAALLQVVVLEVIAHTDDLEKDHLVKNGLRYFLPADGNEDITKRVEYGGDRYPPHDSYQIDRGLFENELASRARSLGVDVLL